MEIFFCDGCQRRITEQDIERDETTRDNEGNLYCRDCRSKEKPAIDKPTTPHVRPSSSRNRISSVARPLGHTSRLVGKVPAIFVGSIAVGCLISLLLFSRQEAEQQPRVYSRSEGMRDLGKALPEQNLQQITHPSPFRNHKPPSAVQAGVKPANVARGRKVMPKPISVSENGAAPDQLYSQETQDEIAPNHHRRRTHSAKLRPFAMRGQKKTSSPEGDGPKPGIRTSVPRKPQRANWEPVKPPEHELVFDRHLGELVAALENHSLPALLRRAQLMVEDPALVDL